jgi:hypothetical protein
MLPVVYFLSLFVENERENIWREREREVMTISNNYQRRLEL